MCKTSSDHSSVQPILRKILPESTRFGAGSMVVCSDVHIAQPDDDRAEQLIQLFAELSESKLECFVLLGDIFDFFMGSSSYYCKKFKEVGDALSRLAASGTRVIYFEGNHEFDLSHAKWAGVEYIDSGNYEFSLSDGTSFIMAHGDLVFSSETYLKFRRFVKSWFVKFAVRQLPGKLMDHLMLKTSHASRAQDQYRTVDHDSLLDRFQGWLNASSSTYGVFGHFHTPYGEKLPKRSGMLISMPCWDQPNALVFDNGQFSRLMKVQGAWTSEALVSYFGTVKES